MENEKLIRLAKKKNNAARAELVSKYSSLCYKVANDFAKKYDDIDVRDLAGEAFFGLMVALDKFEIKKGVAFGYYAKFWVKKYVMTFLEKNHKYINWHLLENGSEGTHESFVESRDVYCDVEKDIRLKEVFGCLNENEKKCQILKMEGYTCNEIAKKTKMKVADVMSLLASAKRKFTKFKIRMKFENLF